MTSLASLLGSGIKSIQRGTVGFTPNTPVTVTVTAVNVNKAELMNLGASGSSVAAASAYLVLTNSTTITVNPGNAIGTVAWQLVERY